MKDGDLILTITRKKPLSAKYIKVHSKFDDRNAKLDPIRSKSQFSNNVLSDMITVYRQESKATINYHYDSVGNRTIKRRATSTVETTKYKYAKDTNQLLSNGKYGYKYDQAGNMIAKGNKYKIEDGKVKFTKKKGEKTVYWSYEYNLQNRLEKVYENGKLIARFVYDPQGNRIKTIRYNSGKQVTYYMYSYRGHVLVEDKEGNYTSYVYAFSKKFAKINGKVGKTEEIVYYHQDNLGSTRVMTNKNGKVVMNQDYMPFGGDLPKPNQL